MFTGIIEELGIVASFIRGAQSAKLTISVSKNFAATKVGESIAVNGACLTVTNIKRNLFEFDISPETVKRTTLNELKIGDKVNLERAIPVAGRLGGHLVSGHVDGVGEIKRKVSQGKGLEMYVSLPSDLIRYLVPKGSVTLDGISLTVAGIQRGLLVVSVVPHTARSTTLALKTMGDKLNIEVDILSKYIERHLKGQMKGLTEDTLTQAGYLPMGWIEN